MEFHNDVVELGKKVTKYCTRKHEDKREQYDTSYLFDKLEDVGDIQQYAYGEEIKELLENKSLIFMESIEGHKLAEKIKTPSDLYNRLLNWDDAKTIFVIDDKNREGTLIAQAKLIEIFNLDKTTLIGYIMDIPVDISFEDLCGQKGYVSNWKWIETALQEGEIDDLRGLYEEISKFH